MKIIDKYTDFYDHYGYTYGVDNKIVFDRRGSSPLTDDQVVLNITYTTFGSWKPDQKNLIVVEVGYYQYLIEIEAEIKDYGFTGTCERSIKQARIIRTFDDNKHYGKNPIGVWALWVFGGWRQGDDYSKDPIPNLRRTKEVSINPILKDCFLTKILDGDVIWKQVMNYISSLGNEVEIKQPDNVTKIESHGFDKKKSFRNM